MTPLMLFFCVVCLQALCEDKSVEDVLQRHFNSSRDFRSMHMLLVQLLASFLLASPFHSAHCR